MLRVNMGPPALGPGPASHKPLRLRAVGTAPSPPATLDTDSGPGDQAQAKRTQDLQFPQFRPL